MSTPARTRCPRRAAPPSSTWPRLGLLGGSDPVGHLEQRHLGAEPREAPAPARPRWGRRRPPAASPAPRSPSSPRGWSSTACPPAPRSAGRAGSVPVLSTTPRPARRIVVVGRPRPRRRPSSRPWPRTMRHPGVLERLDVRRVVPVVVGLSRIRSATSDQSGRTSAVTGQTVGRGAPRRAGRGGRHHQLGGRAAPERALAADQAPRRPRPRRARPRRACGRRTRRPAPARAPRRHICVDCMPLMAPPNHPADDGRMTHTRPDAPCSAPGWPAAPPRSWPAASDDAPASAAASRVGRPCRPRDDLDPQDWDSVRAQFLLDPDAGPVRGLRPLAAHPAPRRRDRRLPRRARPRHRGRAARRASSARQAVRTRPRRTTAAPPAQYALTDSTTMGLGLMYGGLDARAGRRGAHDDPRLLLDRGQPAAARAAHRRDGHAGSRCTTTRPRPPWTRWSSGLAAGITPRTKVVALTWVHSSTGVRVPVRRDLRGARGAQPGAAQPVRRLRRRGARVLAPSTWTCPTWAATSSRPARTSGCSGRAAPASSGAGDWGPLTEVIPTFSDPDRPGRPAHPGRLPLLRAPLGGRGRLRVHGRASGATGWSRAPPSRPRRLKEGLAASRGSP